MAPGKAYHFTHSGHNPRRIEGPLIIIQLCEELASHTPGERKFPETTPYANIEICLWGK